MPSTAVASHIDCRMKAVVLRCCLDRYAMYCWKFAMSCEGTELKAGPIYGVKEKKSTSETAYARHPSHRINTPFVAAVH